MNEGNNFNKNNKGNNIDSITGSIKKKIYKISFLILIAFSVFFFEKRQNLKAILNKDTPKISIFLPIYNKDKYLKRSINSIQRQSIKDIEIIAINDCSTDNSLKILKEMQKIDPRIIIINNKINYGSLYSRAKGISNSKGEYLMCLDPDDKYIGKTNLQLLYETAKNLQVDFITFLIVLSTNKKKTLQSSKFNKILRQPEIFESAFQYNYLKDVYITNKFIKKELFKKAYHLFESQIYDGKWNYHEDNVWSILIYKYANSSVFINKKIYYYYNNNKDSDMNNRGSPLELKNLLYRNEMYKKIFKGKHYEKYLIGGFSELIAISKRYIDTLNKNEEIKIKIIKEIKYFLKIINLDDNMIKKTNEFLNNITKSCY